MKRKLLAILLVSMFSLAMLAACGGDDEPARDGSPENPWRGMVVTQSMANASQAFLWSEFQRLAPNYGWEVSLAAGNNEVHVEIAGIERAITEGYDAIWLNPSDIEPMIPVITRAKEAGIIVGMVNTAIGEENEHLISFFAGTDSKQGAMQAGEFVNQQFPDGANFVEVGGMAGHMAQRQRAEGFRATINPNIVELGSQNCPTGWEGHEAMAIMEDFIVQFGDQIDIVFCHWDNGASAVIEALHAAGMYDVFVIGVDGNATGYNQVMAGTQALSVGQSITEMSRLTLEKSRDLMQGRSVPKFTFIDWDMVTIDNVHDLPFPEW